MSEQTVTGWRLADRADALNPSVIREILKVTERPGVISLAGGLPSADTFPVADFARAARLVLDGQPAAALQYSSSEGYRPLREFIADRLPWDVDPNLVLITTGSQQGLDLLAKVLIDQGSPVLVETPTYLGALQAFSPFGAAVTGVPTDDDGIIPDRLADHPAARDARLLYALPTFQNPTGRMLDEDRRARLVEVAAGLGLPVVEDNPYGLLTLQDAPLPAIRSMDADNVIYLGSFSKTYSMTGWRIGYLAGPAEVIRGMALLQQSFVLSVNSFAQWGAVEAMTGPQDCVEEMRQQFDIRRKAMMEALSTIPNVSFAAPKGAFYIYLNHEKTGLDPVQFCAKLLDEYYVACVPGSEYGPYAGCNTRLSCATGLDDCLEGVDRIRKMVASL